LLALLGLAAAPHLAALPQGDEVPPTPPAQDHGETVVAGPKPYDRFHPDAAAPVKPRFGGRLIVHIDGQPESIFYPNENTLHTRRILYEVHETLLRQDWEYHDYRPNVAESFVVEDLVVLHESAVGKYPGQVEVQVVRRDGETGLRGVYGIYGEVEKIGSGVRVTPRSPGSDVTEALTIAAEDVDTIERGSVFTFTIREGVRWHPSLVYANDAAAQARIGTQFLDARDVRFSWSVYSNPGLDCGERRFMFERMTDCRIVDERRVRFFFQEQYAYSLAHIGTSLSLLPSHIYDLSDPENPAYKPRATASQQAEHMNHNPHNQLWVGLGPYRVTQWTQQHIQAERFTDAAGKALYFDRDHAGFVDVIRWRCIDDDQTAMNALLNGELDYFERLKSADYFGPATNNEAFLGKFYKGHRYLGDYGYTGWNMARPQFADRAVRIAMAHAFDFDAYLKSHYLNLARRTTGPVPVGTEGYPTDLEPFPFDPEHAIELLEEADWYDRDGNGIADKDGVQLSFEFLYPSGNDSSKIFGLKLQESLAAIGIEVRLAQLEWPVIKARVANRDFDACSLAWIPPLEADPQQLWHSSQADVRPTSNQCGVADPEVDRLVEAIQREVDTPKRMELWKQLHRTIYLEVQPYMFFFNVPKKFAINRAIRGVQSFAIDPGYALRRWYFSDPNDSALRDQLDR